MAEGYSGTLHLRLVVAASDHVLGVRSGAVPVLVAAGVLRPECAGWRTLVVRQ